jgi:hypothetical protein
MNCAADLLSVISSDEMLAGIGIGVAVTAVWWWYCGQFSRKNGRQ